MSSWETNDRIELIKQISALDRRLMDIEWKATWAFEAAQKRTKDSLAFWTFAYKATAIAAVIAAWALLLLGKR